MCAIGAIGAVRESSLAVLVKDDGDIQARVHFEETLRLESYTKVLNGHTIIIESGRVSHPFVCNDREL